MHIREFGVQRQVTLRTDSEPARPIGVEIEQRAHDRDVLEQWASMARRDMDRDRYRNQSDENKERRYAGQKPKR